MFRVPTACRRWARIWNYRLAVSRLSALASIGVSVSQKYGRPWYELDEAGACRTRILLQACDHKFIRIVWTFYHIIIYFTDYLSAAAGHFFNVVFDFLTKTFQRLLLGSFQKQFWKCLVNKSNTMTFCFKKSPTAGKTKEDLNTEAWNGIAPTTQILRN